MLLTGFRAVVACSVPGCPPPLPPVCTTSPLWLPLRVSPFSSTSGLLAGLGAWLELGCGWGNGRLLLSLRAACGLGGAPLCGGASSWLPLRARLLASTSGVLGAGLALGCGWGNGRLLLSLRAACGLGGAPFCGGSWPPLRARVFASSSGLLAGAWLELGCGWGNGWLVLRDG